MHDDLFAITHDLVQSLPAGVSGALGVLLISVLLAWIKWKAEEGQRAKHQRSALPELCTFPLCGKNLELVPKTARVRSKHCELEYCSSRCFKRDWRENNHPSVGTLLKRRREELMRDEQMRQVQAQRGWLDQLSDLIPEPQGLYRGELDKIFSSVSSQMEADAFTITARTFCQAYMAKFSMAVHGWSSDCYASSGRGAVVIHLSEKALQQSFGAPLSYVSQRVVELLQDHTLSKLVQTYDHERQLVLYIFQRGVNKKHLAFPYCFSVYEADLLPRAGAESKGRGGGGENSRGERGDDDQGWHEENGGELRGHEAAEAGGGGGTAAKRRSKQGREGSGKGGSKVRQRAPRAEC